MSDPERNMPRLVRLNVNLNQETADALRDIVGRNGISYTEAVRRSIAIYKYLSDEVAAGRTIQTAGKRGKHAKEVVLL